MLLAKTKKLEEFYQKSDFSVICDNKKSIANQPLEVVFNMIYAFEEDITTMEFSQVFKNFKKNGTNTFDSFYRIDFYFSELTYSITIDNNPSEIIKKLNHEYLIKEEIDLIVSTITDKLLSQIQQRIKNK